MVSRTGQALRWVPSVPNGFSPCVQSPSLIVRGSLLKLENVLSIFIHCGESTGCLSIPSFFLSSASCYLKNLALFSSENKRLNLRMIEDTKEPSSEFLSFLPPHHSPLSCIKTLHTLDTRTNPCSRFHIAHNPFDMHVFSHILYLMDTIISLPRR